MEKNNAVLTIGIVGENKFGETLNQIDGREIGGKIINIKRFESLNGLAECQVVYVSESESHQTKEILQSIDASSTLTIGEIEEFTRMGGIIRFFTERNRIRFEINKTEALRSDLKFSSKLLEIARIIQ